MSGINIEETKVNKLKGVKVICCACFSLLGISIGLFISGLVDWTYLVSPLVISIISVIIGTIMTSIEMNEDNKHHKIERTYEAYDRLGASNPNFFRDLKSQSKQYRDVTRNVVVRSNMEEGELINLVFTSYGQAIKRGELKYEENSYLYTTLKQLEVVLGRYYAGDFDDECFKSMLSAHIKDTSTYLMPYLYASMIIMNVKGISEDRAKFFNKIDDSVNLCKTIDIKENKNILRFVSEYYNDPVEENVLYNLIPFRLSESTREF